MTDQTPAFNHAAEAETIVGRLGDLAEIGSPLMPEARTVALAAEGIIHALLALNATIAAGFIVTRSRLDHLINEAESIRCLGINQER